MPSAATPWVVTASYTRTVSPAAGPLTWSELPGIAPGDQSADDARDEAQLGGDAGGDRDPDAEGDGHEEHDDRGEDVPGQGVRA